MKGLRIGFTAAMAVAAVLALFPQPVRSQDRPRIAIVGLVARDLVEETEAITEEIRTGFVKSGCYIVVDRTLSDKIFAELAMQQSGATESDKAVHVGKLFAVKQIVSGKFNKFSGGGWQISAAVLDAETGETSKAETVRYQGDFFSLLNERVPQLAKGLVGQRCDSKAAAPVATPAVATVRIAPTAPAPAVPAPQASAANPPPAPVAPPPVVRAAPREGPLKVAMFPPLFKGDYITTRGWTHETRRETADAQIFASLRGVFSTELASAARLPNDKPYQDTFVGFLSRKPNDAMILASAKQQGFDVAIVYEATFTMRSAQTIWLYDVPTGKRFEATGTIQPYPAPWSVTIREIVEDLASQVKKDESIGIK